ENLEKKTRLTSLLREISELFRNSCSILTTVTIRGINGEAVELTAAGRWFIWMNYFVHSIMYTYYAIVSIGIRLPKRLSMTVTALQTTQMLIGVMISVYVLYLKLNGAVSEFIVL
ncbi:GNS1/SUR4 family protein, partial [Ancylostoma duodenale]